MDYLKLHKEKKTEWKALFERMKSDSALITNTKYVIRDAKQKEVENMIGVMGNRPSVFATFVEAALNRADEKVYVESDDEKVDTAEIEDAIKRMFRQANRRRRTQGLPSIESYLDQQHCRRGRSMARPVVKLLTDKDGKEYLDIDIALWDTRYVTCEEGADGLAWGAYETIKSKNLLEKEPWTKEIELLIHKREFTISGTSARVVDMWTPEANLIYVDEEKVYEQGHPFGFTPLVYQVVPIGSMSADEGNIQHEGESIFFMIRHLIPEFNRLVSIMQTHNMRSIKGALQQAVEDPTDEAQVGDYEKMNEMGAVTGVKTPNAITPIPYTEVRESAILLLREITKAIDDGSLSPIILGDLPGAMSAVALLEVEQGQGQVFEPRLGSRGVVKESLAEMFFAEMKVERPVTIELGVKGHKKSFKTSKFEGEYDITFSYTSKSPETDYARLSMAKQWKGIIDDKTILADILKRDDPEGDLNRVRRQELRAFSPTLVIYDGLMALTDLYEDGDESIKDEIDIVEAELGVNLDSIKAGILPQAPGQRKAEGETELPVVTNTGRTSAQKASDLIRTPAANIEGE